MRAKSHNQCRSLFILERKKEHQLLEKLLSTLQAIFNFNLQLHSAPETKQTGRGSSDPYDPDVGVRQFSQHQASAMEVSSFWINLFLLLISQPEQSWSVHRTGFPHVSPERLQFFEYETVTVQCEHLDGVNDWRVKRKFNEKRATNSSDPCSSAEPSCTLDPALEIHSGEYWCENDEGEKSNSVNISIRVGLVILGTPIQTVAEGSDVTLRCIHQQTELSHIRDFYKDGLHLMTCYSSNMTIRNVSKADEGNYRCSISGAGESPESWLAVHQTLTAPSEGSPTVTGPSVKSPLVPLVRSKPCKTFILQSTAKFLLVALLSAVIALIHYKRKRRTRLKYFVSGKQTGDSKGTKTEAESSRQSEEETEI
ncbi:low affinity immunoglobulin gamma Fc region receptor II-like isoform X1 [Poecilia formosa]|uniref:low affinity immunoglobulin gamma Fc region receptor II-like isoform X1 n=1 Tax=Poecilia formosa TaxID=48698 RepID=UPI0007BA64EC|nr:PREDICTED: low affinity immunoglobulin gamma Fc region receptor II-like isoform X1 [Poecilia formosa]